MLVIMMMVDFATACLSVTLLISLDPVLKIALQRDRYRAYKSHLDSKKLYFGKKLPPSDILATEVARVHREGDQIVHTLRDNAATNHFFEARIPRLINHFRTALVLITVLAAGGIVFGVIELLTADITFDRSWAETTISALKSKWYSLAGLLVLISAAIGLRWEFAHFHRAALNQLGESVENEIDA